MTPVDQKYLKGNAEGIPGDCVRACVCSILDLPIEAVPHFVRWHGIEWADAMIAWCEQNGIDADWNSETPISEGEFCMKCGPSPRDGRHAVVIQDGQIVHDPHPSRAGLSDGRFVTWTFRRQS